MAQIVTNWITSGTGSNIAVVGDKAEWKVEFEFTNPPQSADKVVITIAERILNLDGNAKTYHADCTKLFEGFFKGSKFTCTLHRGGKDRSSHRNNEYRISISSPPHVNIMRATIDDPELVSSHTLTLKTTFKGAAKGDEFVGTQQVHVKFPLAMVIPKGTATLDTTLNMLRTYGGNWQKKQPQYRLAEQTTMIVTKNLKGKLQPSHYDDIVRALTKAANFATAGVVALTVGHGGADASVEGEPFFNLVPEDNKRAVTKVDWLARITQGDLVSFDKPPKKGAVKISPDHNTRVRLDALDRIADALAGTPIRRLILHCCNAGNAPDFVQLVANRLRVPVVAHTDFIMVEPAASFYEKDGQAKLPRDEEFWPTHRLGDVKVPREDAPPRFGPPGT
jgi:hypothetical protein